MSERARVRRNYGSLCPTLVAAKNGSICIAVILVSVSGGVIVLSERLVREVAVITNIGLIFIIQVLVIEAGSICIAVVLVSVSGGVIALSERLVREVAVITNIGFTFII